jgi:hypothetical protein
MFAPPPPAIGEVLCAGSTASRGEAPVSLGTQIQRGGVLLVATFFVVGFCAFIVLIILGLLLHALGVPKSILGGPVEVLAVLIGAFAAAKVSPLALGVNAPAMCSYVGREGVAIFLQRPGEGSQRPTKLLLFADARALVRTARDERERPEHDPRIRFAFQWFALHGKHGALRLAGLYEEDGRQSEAMAPHRHDHALARAAEAAWNQHLLARARAQIAQRGYVELVRDRADTSRRARVGTGYLEIIAGDRVERWEAREIDAVTVEGGTVCVRRRDFLRGINEKTFRYEGGAMENESFFPLAIEALAGITVEPAGMATEVTIL